MKRDRRRSERQPDRDRSNSRDEKRGSTSSDSISSPEATLQRSIGNQAVRALHSTRQLSDTDDPSGGTDDRILAQSRTGPESNLQKSQHIEDVGSENAVKTQERIREVIAEPGRPMDGSVQREMEATLGGDFSNVRIHTGPKASTATKSINARAFTVGNHIALNRGEYQPNANSGKQLLAHELTHVRQQGTVNAASTWPTHTRQSQSGIDVGHGMYAQPKSTAKAPTDPAEQEAEAASDVVASGPNIPDQRLPLGNISESILTRNQTDGGTGMTDQEIVIFIVANEYYDFFRRINSVIDEVNLSNTWDVLAFHSHFAKGYEAMRERLGEWFETRPPQAEFTELAANILSSHFPEMQPKFIAIANFVTRRGWGDWVYWHFLGYGLETGGKPAQDIGPFDYDVLILDAGVSAKFLQIGGFVIQISYSGNAPGTDPWDEWYAGGFGGFTLGASLGAGEVLDTGEALGTADFDAEEYWAKDDFVGRIAQETLAGASAIVGMELSGTTLYGNGLNEPVSFSTSGFSLSLQVAIEGPGTKQGYLMRKDEDEEDPNVDEIDAEQARRLFGEYEFEDGIQLFFGIDESTIDDESRLNEFVENYWQAFQTGEYELRITGHASPTGPGDDNTRRRYNMVLSAERVQSAVDHIAHQLAPEPEYLFLNTYAWDQAVGSTAPSGDFSAHGEESSSFEPGTEYFGDRRVDIEMNGSLFAEISTKELDDPVDQFHLDILIHLL